MPNQNRGSNELAATSLGTGISFGGRSLKSCETQHPRNTHNGSCLMKIRLFVGVITVFPRGLAFRRLSETSPYPESLPLAREFFFHSSQLLKKNKPLILEPCIEPEKPRRRINISCDTLHENKDQLVMAVYVLDPYETLLDGSHSKFLFLY